jgi:hypothetical protein
MGIDGEIAVIEKVGSEIESRYQSLLLIGLISGDSGKESGGFPGTLNYRIGWLSKFESAP